MKNTIVLVSLIYQGSSTAEHIYKHITDNVCPNCLSVLAKINIWLFYYPLHLSYPFVQA